MMSSRQIRNGANATRAVALVACGMFVALACEEGITAPGVCPDFCPLEFIEVMDTTLVNVVERDSAFRGYARAIDGPRMQVTSRDADLRARGMVRFIRFPDSVPVEGVNQGILSVDSYVVRVELRDRDLAVSDLEILVHRIPATVDTNTTFEELTAFFEDSTIVGRATVNDTSVSDSVFITLSADAFPTFAADSSVAAIGLSVSGPTPTFATVGTSDGFSPTTLTRYVKAGPSEEEASDGNDVRGPAFDSFVSDEVARPAGDLLMVGGTPAARSLLRLNLPSGVMDSAEIVGAKLFLVPVAPTVGAPGDSFRVQVDALSADFGPKSPLIVRTGLDSADLFPGVLVAVGTTDTIALDITEALREFQADSNRPHSVMIRVTPSDEGAVLGELFVGSSRTPDAVPFMSITFVPPFRFEGQS